MAHEQPVTRESAFWPDLEKVPRIGKERSRQLWNGRFLRLLTLLILLGSLAGAVALALLWIVVRRHLQNQ